MFHFWIFVTIFYCYQPFLYVEKMMIHWHQPSKRWNKNQIANQWFMLQPMYLIFMIYRTISADLNVPLILPIPSAKISCKPVTVNFPKDFIPGLLEDLLDQWPRQSTNFYLFDWKNTAAESVEDHLVQTITAVCTRTEMNNRHLAFCLSEAWQTFLNQ